VGEGEGNFDGEYEFLTPDESSKRDAAPPPVEILFIGGGHSGQRIVVEELSDNEVLIDPDTLAMESYQQDKPGSTHYFIDRRTTFLLNLRRREIADKLNFKPRILKGEPDGLADADS
jgi:hypothetical protein